VIRLRDGNSAEQFDRCQKRLGAYGAATAYGSAFRIATWEQLPIWEKESTVARQQHAQTVNDRQKLVCHCSRKSTVFRAFGQALLAGQGLRKTWSRAVLSPLQINVSSRQPVTHNPVVSATQSRHQWHIIPSCIV
jgi:hypothetical protein